MAHVVVIGAGLGGLPAAYELRHHLPREHRVTLISDKPEFTFIPGLIEVALNLAPLERIQLDLAKYAKKQEINWVCSEVTALDPYSQRIAVEGGQTIDYDCAAIATGASLAFDEIAGLGPHGGYTQSICTPAHALTAREAWQKFLENPGALVVGAMPGAGCFGSAYEFVLMADWELRRHGLRDRASITYVTPEPHVGHLGVGGVKNAAELTSELMRSRGIKTIVNGEIARVSPQTITLADGCQLPFQYSMILPSFRGAKFLQAVPRLTNNKGFIPVLPTYQHPEFSSLYAIGVSVQLDQPDKTPVPIGLPKSGQMTEAMAAAVSHNIAVKLGTIKEAPKTPTLQALCFAEFGNTGIAYIAVPVLPDPVTGKRLRSYAVKGLWVKWAKHAFEKYFMLKMRLGVGLPWFEKLGLRILFGLSLLKPLSTAKQNHRQLATVDSRAAGYQQERETLAGRS